MPESTKKTKEEQLDELKEEVQETSISVIKEEYEKKIDDMKRSYEQRISDMQSQHIKEIREIMTTGSSPEYEKIKEPELSEEEQILVNLRKKYNIN